MKEIIIIKYGELTTKKDNINFFINCLKNNIENSLKKIDCKIIYDIGRMYIESSHLTEVKNELAFIFGIHEYFIGYETEEKDIEEITKRVIELIKNKNFNTFKVETKRADKTYPSKSMDISKKIGGIILNNNSNLKVDVHNPEIIINIEIRSNKTLIYFDKHKGLGGYPVGTLGKGVLMLSGGIDSPVAGYLAMKRGIRLEAIYFESPPHTSNNALNKVLELAEKLSLYSLYLKVHVINFTEIQESIYKNCPHEYMITIMRRMMYRISEKIAYKNNAKVIINGESVGQVASQTLTSMQVINEAIKMPVLRPVCCFDKIEIINLAKKIDTYETSILPYEDCCTIFVPEHPIINPELEKAIDFENRLNYEEMIENALKTMKTIKIESKNSKYTNIL